MTDNALPPDLAYGEHTKNAKMLYLALRIVCAGGVEHESLYGLGIEIGLSRKQTKDALSELHTNNFIILYDKSVPMGEIPGGGLICGDIPVCRLGISAPTLQDRLTQSGWEAIRKQVFERDDYVCAYCKTRGGNLECDHVMPISKGGTNELGNLVTACAPCNRSKRDKQLTEWRHQMV